MSENAEQQARNVLANLPTLLPDLESVYKDIHSHPELSMQEKRTAGIAADRLPIGQVMRSRLPCRRGRGESAYSATATAQPSCSELIWMRYLFVKRRGGSPAT